MGTEQKALKSETSADEIQRLLDTGTIIGEPKGEPVALGPFVVVPAGHQVVDLEEYAQRERPLRTQETAKLVTLESFLDYVRNHDVGTTAIFANVRDNPSFHATFDFHTKDLPAHKSHQAHFDCPRTKEWLTWSGANGKKMDQATFALFIEDNLPDIFDPKAADMLAIAHTLEAKKSVDFGSSIRLDNGQVQFKYSETVQGSAQQGALQIPDRFVLHLAVFEGDDQYSFEARFRYRIIQGGRLELWYDLWRANKVIEAAAKRLHDRIKAALPTIPTYVGSI